MDMVFSLHEMTCSVICIGPALEARMQTYYFTSSLPDISTFS